eukprot:1072783-Amphidinium_carterae.1
MIGERMGQTCHLMTVSTGLHHLPTCEACPEQLSLCCGKVDMVKPDIAFLALRPAMTTCASCATALCMPGQKTWDTICWEWDMEHSQEGKLFVLRVSSRGTIRKFVEIKTRAHASRRALRGQRHSVR